MQYMYMISSEGNPHSCVWAHTGEKAALMARLAKLKDAGTDELREKAELQEALVRCAAGSTVQGNISNRKVNKVQEFQSTLLLLAQRLVSAVCAGASLTARGS